ncbi:MAG: DUF4145 domain-containing protein [Phycisphaerales bacterium]|nr:DUF4145 domain-containing protein [Phycisphaerales bacterium]
MPYIAPQSGLKSFTCPHCSVIARQYHYYSSGKLDGSQYGVESQNPVRVSKCEHCEKLALWYFDQLVYPNRGASPPPNPDMPCEVAVDYEEAAGVSTQSPRGSPALLRLAIQKLCIHLGGKGKNINDDIALLMKNGLPQRVQQALDVVRVVGNNAVHPGQIAVDDGEVVAHLFTLVNLIAEYMISMPKKIAGLYDDLPAAARSAIAKRDDISGSSS